MIIEILSEKFKKAPQAGASQGETGQFL